MKSVYLVIGLGWESSAVRPQCLAFYYYPTSKATTTAHLFSLLENEYIYYKKQKLSCSTKLKVGQFEHCKTLWVLINNTISSFLVPNTQL